MKKIPTLFVRDENRRLVINQVNEGCEWVTEGLGVSTRKYDGTCVMVRAGLVYKRYDCKKGRTPPPGFEPAQEFDPVTGHQPGWLLVDPMNPADRYFVEGYKNTCMLHHTSVMPDATYELCGPKVNGNPESFAEHIMLPHGHYRLRDCPRDFDDIKAYLTEWNIEGIVWHHPDGRMVKIKARDFGIKREKVEAASNG